MRLGLADRDSAAPVQEDTLFQAGSVSKPVAAFGARKHYRRALSIDPEFASAKTALLELGD
ncbi:MAG: serine hydrolase [Lysobacterales bacterium]